MRLYPAMTEEEVYAELKTEAIKEYGEAGAEALEESLKALAEAMSAISANPLPVTVAPLFP